MIKRLIRWQFWRWRYSYWKRRAVLAERQLKAEMWRNREREDTLVTVPMRLGGLWGMPARNAPALVKNVSRETPQLTQSTDPWDALSWADKQEYELFWKADAAAANVPEHIARQQFYAVLAERKTADEPFAAN